MCRVEEEYAKVREARGEARGQLRTICKLIKRGHLTVDEAVDEFGISPETIRTHLDGSGSE